MANHKREVVQLLGVEIGEVFQLAGDTSLENNIFKIADGSLQTAQKGENDTDWWVASDDIFIDILIRLLHGKLSIHKLPWKPEKGETYYVPAIGELYKYYTSHWLDDDTNRVHYRRGLVCKTKEEAIALTKILLDKIQEVQNNG